MQTFRWIAGVAVAGSVVGLTTTAIPSQAAAPHAAQPHVRTTHFAKIDPSLLRGSKYVPDVLSDKKVTVVLQMSGAPVAVRSAKARRQGAALRTAQRRDIRAGLAAQQNRLHSRLASLGAHIVGQMQDAYNGIQLVATQRSIPALAALPNVTAIHAVTNAKLQNVNAIPYIGATQAWSKTDGEGSHLTGKGVKVAIIDTGIDYTHADFGGIGTTAAYNYALAHDTVDPATDPQLAKQFGPNAPKAIGGYDFVGDAYNADDPAHNTPQPDKNPLDCNSHGTHTAGTLAGFGVLANGKTYTGAYNKNTVTAHDPNGKWLVGPGAAPQASLLVYRVFGCAGTTNVDDLAINQAVKDGASVISMSLGAPYGTPSDPSAVAAQNAVNDGVTVVAADGNNGHSGYLTSSPASANGAISVAAMDATVPSYPGATLHLSTGKTVDTIDANGAPLPSGTLPVVVLKNPDGSISLGCDKSEYAGTAGKLVVTARGTCARVARAVFGDEAGAAAVVMVNNADTLPPYEGKITSDPDTGEQHNVTIPFLGAKQSDGPTLLAADGGTTTITATTVANTTYKQTADFSSGGPRSGDSAPKPDVIAPGVSVTSAGMGTGNGTLVDSGTSMATPMVAGVAALVKQAHPNWQATQIKAAIVNTADPSLNDGYDPQLAGTGVVQAQRAIKAPVLATTNDQLDALAFGYVPGSGDYTDQKAITYTNNSDSARHYTLSVSSVGSTLGTSVSVVPSTVTVPAHGSTLVQVHLSIPASAFAAMPSDDTGAIGPGGVMSVRGAIVATPRNNGQSLRTEYLLVPRGLSDVEAGAADPTGTRNAFGSDIPLENDGIHSGSADLYEWGLTDPRDVNTSADVRDVGLQVLPGQTLGGSSSDRSLIFLVNTWSPASNQAQNEYDIAIDTNGDGAADYVVFAADLGLVTAAGVANGEMAAFVENATTGALVDAFLTDDPMNGTTIELPLLASDLGLTANKSKPFTYQVTGFDYATDTPDSTKSAAFDPFNPAVTTGEFTTLDPGQTGSFPVSGTRKLVKRDHVRGWLVATTDDAGGAAQADEVAIPAKAKASS
jgi:minor extracellular serine protease Vpr